MSRPVVLITGASTGIGLEIARLVLKGPYRAVLTARSSSLDRFEEEGIYESEFVHLRALDVVDAQERRGLIEECCNRWGGVDVLINNAGVSYRSVIEHMTDEDEDSQMGINYLGPMALIRLVLPSMRAKRGGRIINISSVSGMMAMPTMSAYSASKHALEGATESLWYEMKPWGIKVSLVQPGFVRSKGFEKVHITEHGKRALRDTRDPYHAYYRHMTRFVSWMMNHSPSTSAHVAEKVLKTMKAARPKLRIAGTFDARVFYILRRLLPRQLYHTVLYNGLPQISSWGPVRSPGLGESIKGKKGGRLPKRLTDH